MTLIGFWFNGTADSLESHADHVVRFIRETDALNLAILPLCVEFREPPFILGEPEGIRGCLTAVKSPVFRNFPYRGGGPFAIDTTPEAPKWRRKRMMSDADVIIIPICFHFNTYCNFKHCYLSCVRGQWRHLFPWTFSYNR